jgi:YD repeat-containing protein
MYDQPETITEVLGSVTRTKVETYDAAGRLQSSQVTSSSAEDKPVPKVTYAYSQSTGAQTKQTSEGGGTIEAFYNTLGQMTEYKDGSGNVARYSYEEPDGLLTELTDSSGSGQGKATYQRYSYDPTTKALVKLEDSAAGTFTATYDAEGNLLSEVYPNAMCANYAYNAMGEATELQYVKTGSCAEANPKVWYTDSLVSSIHGETMEEHSTLAAASYGYDSLGRLMQTQETPTGKGCTTRVYAYNEESARTSLSTHEAQAGEPCTSQGASTELHAYDEADRLTDSGISYDALGNATKLPASDAGGHELTSSFYASNQVQSQTQNGTTLQYTYDAEGRATKTASEVGLVKKTTISHYDAPGTTPAWTCEGATTCEAGKWTRNIAGIGGTLAAVQTNGGEAVLQLHDLKGDVVATAEDNPNATALLSTYNSSEFGVPNGEKPLPPFAWLGASGVSSTLSSGVIVEGGTSYVPQTGRTLQTQAVEPPGLPYGTGAGAPVSFQEEPWMTQGAARNGAEAPGLEAAREFEVALAACRANPAACDPVHNLALLTPAEAAVFGDSLCDCSTLHGVGNGIEALLSQIGIQGSAIGEAIEEFATSGLIEHFGKELYLCGKALMAYEKEKDRCAVELHTLSVFGVDLWIPSGLSVGRCYYNKKSKPGLKAGYLYCYPSGISYRPGSW